MEDNTVISRLKKAWNAFTNRDPTGPIKFNSDVGYSYRPDRVKLTRGNERSIITSIFNRMALDVASINFIHCKLDENGRYSSDVNSGLNNCLQLEANIDQTNISFIQDIVLSMLDEGCVAIVPIDTIGDPIISNTFDILTMRTGKITEWKSDSVLINVYNDRTGKREEIWMPKLKLA